MAQDPAAFLERDDMEGPGVQEGKGQPNFGWAYHPEKMVLIRTDGSRAVAPLQPCHRTGRTWRYPCLDVGEGASKKQKERVRLHTKAHNYFLLNGDTEAIRHDLEGHRNLIRALQLPTVDPGRYTAEGQRTDSQQQADEEMKEEQKQKAPATSLFSAMASPHKSDGDIGPTQLQEAMMSQIGTAMAKGLFAGASPYKKFKANGKQSLVKLYNSATAPLADPSQPSFGVQPHEMGDHTINQLTLGYSAVERALGVHAQGNPKVSFGHAFPEKLVKEAADDAEAEAR